MSFVKIMSAVFVDTPTHKSKLSHGGKFSVVSHDGKKVWLFGVESTNLSDKLLISGTTAFF